MDIDSKPIKNKRKADTYYQLDDCKRKKTDDRCDWKRQLGNNIIESIRIESGGEVYDMYYTKSWIDIWNKCINKCINK